MKKLCVLTVLFVFLITASAFAGQNPMDDGIYPGMTVKEFKKIHPDLKLKDGGGQWTREAEIYGLKGKWAYQFKDGKLEWFLFDYYLQDYKKLNEKNFKKCLGSTKKIMSDLTKLYGKPAKIEEGTTRFRDPSKDRHWGYDVIEGRWNTGKMKIKAKFKFFGGKGEYFFTVSVNYSK